MPDKFKKNKDDDMNLNEFDDLDLEETLSGSLEEINDIDSEDNTSLEKALDSVDSNDDLGGLDDLSDLTDIPDNPDDFSIDRGETEQGEASLEGISEISDDLSLSGDVDLDLDTPDDLDIDIPLDNDLDQVSEMSPADDDLLSSSLSSEKMPEDSDDIDLSKDLGFGEEALTPDLDESVKIDENGEVDLSQDLGDLDLSENISVDADLPGQVPEPEDTDIDEELNLDDDFDVNKDIDLTESADLDSELDLDSISSSDLSLDSENIPGDEFRAVSEDIDLPEVEDSLKDLENSELEDLDLKSDLGLGDSLQLSENEGAGLSDEKIDFDLVDDEGMPIGTSEEEFGVDLKSGPETIETYLFGKPENEEHEEIVKDEELDKSFEEDQEVEKIKVREKKPLVLDDEQSDFLSKDLDGMDELDISSELGEEEHKDEELLDEIKLDEDISKDETQELSLESLEDEAFDGTSPEPEEDKISLDEDLSEELGSFETIDELDDINNENAEIPSLQDELDDVLTIDEEHFGASPSDGLSAGSSGDGSEDISAEDLEVDLLEEEIGGTGGEEEGVPEDTSEEPINLKGASKTKKDIDMSKIDKTPSELETEITDESGFEEHPLQEDEAISIEDSELSEIEDKLFPDEGSMPPLDEDIANVELSSGTDDEMADSVSPLSDAESVFSDDLSGEINEEDEIKFDDIDLEHIPHPSLDKDAEEEETIALSDDELDNIITGTQIIESDAEVAEEELSLEDELSKPEAFEEDETETIDMDSFNADLEEIKSDDLDLSQTVEDDEVYADLKKEMQVKEEGAGVPDAASLKTNVKAVLSYLDRLLDALPEDKIREFAESDEFDVYKKLFEDLNIKY
jgi:pilus assembly protein FimV